MISLNETEKLVRQVKELVESDKKNEIKLSANGGNAILLICSPEEEYQFIETIKKMLNNKLYELIDVNKLLIKFIGENMPQLIEKFDLLRSSIQQIFMTSDEEDKSDFFSWLISKIEQTFEDGRVPVIYSILPPLVKTIFLLSIFPSQA